MIFIKSVSLPSGQTLMLCLSHPTSLLEFAMRYTFSYSLHWNLITKALEVSFGSTDPGFPSKIIDVCSVLEVFYT